MSTYKEKGSDEDYVEIVKKRLAIMGNSADLKLFTNPVQVSVENEVRHDDSLSLNLFTAYFEMLFKKWAKWNQL